MALLKYWFWWLLILVISSCDFNINDMPGPQMSYSVKEAKSHGTFICEYEVPGNVINGISIETAFAENQFWRDNQFLLPKKIDCCKSQLVIVAKDLMESDSTSYNKTWTIQGFDSKSSYVIYKNLNFILLPDSISIKVMAINGKDTSHLIKKIILYKVKSN